MKHKRKMLNDGGKSQKTEEKDGGKAEIQDAEKF